ncbi:MAG TPA: hypothetical protein VE007_12545 [Thermoanaerobaculia bacterium]|nr:hypothetical protein [Thermoanaerobaculia bacterium]
MATTRSKTRAKAGSSKSQSSKGRSSKASSSKTGNGGSTARKRGSGKRDLVKTPTGNFFSHRDGEGKFREMDEMGRSLAADRRTKAKTKVSSGYGDRGDR